MLYQDDYQLNGTAAHRKSDNAAYSTKKSMLQYSVCEIDNSEHMLNNIITDINNTWMKQFDQSDSVYVFQLSKGCKVTKFGYAQNEDSDLLIVK